MVVFGDDLDDVAHAEANPGLLAGNELVFGGVVFKLSPHVDLWEEKKHTGPRGGGELGEGWVWVDVLGFSNKTKKKKKGCGVLLE